MTEWITWATLKVPTLNPRAFTDPIFVVFAVILLAISIGVMNKVSFE